MKKLNAKIVDEHFYNSPQWFKENVTRYDSYDRNGRRFSPVNMPRKVSRLPVRTTKITGIARWRKLRL
ncbi:hypothetical protein [Flavobacterium sp. 3HN19-14]|uniref:hypothetical protein n=1 Tax=Flavobacterium sp. 3HN19-14 TaxID=3448133 RepID=UPI003EE06A90